MVQTLSLQLRSLDGSECLASATLHRAVEKAVYFPEVSGALPWCRRLVSSFQPFIKDLSVKTKAERSASSSPQHYSGCCYKVELITLHGAESSRATATTLCNTLGAKERWPHAFRCGVFHNGKLWYVEIMKPLVEITEATGTETWVTFSTIRPLLHELLKVHLTPKPRNTRQQKALKSPSSLWPATLENCSSFLKHLLGSTPKGPLIPLSSGERTKSLNWDKMAAVSEHVQEIQES